MKLEFLDNIRGGVQFDGIATDQLVRLFDFDKLEANKFKQAIQLELVENGRPLDLAKIKFIENLNCNLTLRIAKNDDGITTIDKKSFFCDLTINGYKEMTSLLAPFCVTNTANYQWLYDIDTPIEFLFSPGAKW